MMAQMKRGKVKKIMPLFGLDPSRWEALAYLFVQCQSRSRMDFTPGCARLAQAAALFQVPRPNAERAPQHRREHEP